jgi:hypothetical protein
MKTPKKQTDQLDDMAKMVKKAQLFAARILHRSKNSDLVIKDAGDASRLLASIASLSRACCELEKVKLERDGSLRQAIQVLGEDIRLRLERRPDLYAEVRKEIYGAQTHRIMEMKENDSRALLPSKTQLMANHLEVTLVDPAEAGDIEEADE